MCGSDLHGTEILVQKSRQIEWNRMVEGNGPQTDLPE